jgi:type VI secretion system Hcp family effector
MKKEKICLAVCVLILAFIIALPGGVACAATFLQIKGIEGESTDKDHERWIDVLSYSSSVVQSSSGTASSGRSRGSVAMGDISITKQIDKATPKLYKAMATGTHFAEIEIVVRDSGQSTIYKLKDVAIASITKSGGNEIVKFRFKSGNYAVLLSK